MTDLFGHTPTIKAITLWQPWASLVAAGVKRHETRHWKTDYRGPIAIHAAQRLDLAGCPDQLCADVLGQFWAKEIPLGAVVAVARLTACHQAHIVADHITPADREAGNFARGRFAWELQDIRALIDPVPATGRQGLFNWSPPAELDARRGPVIDHGAACRFFRWAA